MFFVFANTFAHHPEYSKESDFIYTDHPICIVFEVYGVSISFPHIMSKTKENETESRHQMTGNTRANQTHKPATIAMAESPETVM